jgi:hypothetical protein
MTGDTAGAWCSIAFGQEPRQSGYVRCDDLEQQQSPPAANPVQQSAAAASSPASSSSSPPATSESIINELIRISGMETQFRQMSDTTAVAAGLRSRGVSSAEAAQVLRAMERAFTPEVFLRPIRNQLRSSYNPVFVQQVLNWYRTPVAQRVTDAEIRASDPRNAQRFIAYTKQLETHPPAAERLALVRRLDAIVDLSEIQFAVVRAVLRGIAARLNPALSAKNRLTDARLENIMEGLEQQRPAFRELMLARYLYSYQQVSDFDLREYVQFWETEPGRWFRNAYLRGSLEGVQRAALRMTDLLLKTMPGRQARGRPQ